MSLTIMEVERIIAVSLSILIIVGLIYYLKVGKDRDLKKAIVVVLACLSVIVVILQLRLNYHTQTTKETINKLIIQERPSSNINIISN